MFSLLAAGHPPTARLPQAPLRLVMRPADDAFSYVAAPEPAGWAGHA